MAGDEEELWHTLHEKVKFTRPDDVYEGVVFTNDEDQMREINPTPPVPEEDPAEQVTIYNDHRAYYVKLPRRGRLGDCRLFDGETGLPLNIGPTHRGPGEWTTPEAALAHFQRIAAAFDRL